MKKLLCQEIGGACDKVITGATPDEMGENCKQHCLQMTRDGDPDHREALENMRDLSPGEFAVFWANFRTMFEEAEEI